MDLGAPAPVTVDLGAEFTMVSGETAPLAEPELTMRLIGVAGDERCPREIESAVRGPGSLSLTAQIGGTAESIDINLQAFTGNHGRTPVIQFEGLRARVVYQGYWMRVVSVLPYPERSFNEIRESE